MTLSPAAPLYGLEYASVGQGSVVVARALATAGLQVAWLVTLEGAVAWEGGGRRLWLRPGSVLKFEPSQVMAGALPARGANWRVAVLGYAGIAARQHARYLERKYGTLQHLELRSGPVAGAKRLATARARGRVGWRREQQAADWVAGLHRHLLDHHLALPDLFSLRPTDERLVAFAGRTIKDLAAEMGFSRTYLTRKLAAAWGRPPSAVLRALRIQKAGTLLRHTELSTEAVAAEAGFDSVSGLFTAFHREYGMTPGSFRRRRESAPAAPAPRVRARAKGKRVKAAPSGPEGALRDAVHAPNWDGPYFRLLTCGQGGEMRNEPFDIALGAVVKRYCVVITLDGSAVFEAADRSIPVRTATAVAYPEPMNARWRPVMGTKPWTRIWLQLHGPLAEAFFNETVERSGNVYHLPPTSEPVKRARQIARWVNARREEPAIFWSQHTYRWLLSWRAYLERGRSRAHAAVYLKDAQSRLLAYPPTSLQRYADQLGYSISYVSQKLKYQWNDTPGKILRSARLDLAAEQLRTTTKPVHQIAVECGYKTPSSFIIAFKRREQLTPLAYRHKRRK